MQYSSLCLKAARDSRRNGTSSTRFRSEPIVRRSFSVSGPRASSTRQYGVMDS